MSDVPFLPVQRSVYKVGDFLGWARAGALELSPYYQRRSSWKRPAKSLLIDTMMRGLPVPVIILRDRLELKSQVVTREVVDGQQRLRTVLNYLGFRPSEIAPGDESDWDSFTVLKAHNAALSEASNFSGLPEDLQRRFLEYEFAVHVLPSHVDDGTVLRIFTRLNSTGANLTAAEVRNAEFHGPFAALVKDLAISNVHRWREWRVISDAMISRMGEMDLVADLCITVAKGAVYANTKKNIQTFYEDLESLDEWVYREELQRRFDEVIRQLANRVPHEVWGGPVTNRTIFTAVWTAAYDAIFGLGTPLDRTPKPKSLPKSLEARFADLDLRLRNRDELPKPVSDALKGASSDVRRRRARFEFVASVLGL